MTITIAFCDLTHTGHSCNSMPYGISLIAGYARHQFGDRINFDIYKYPADLLSSIEHKIPNILCFSNYIWNTELSCEIARSIKQRSPQSIIVFGGPNYPIGAEEQEAFLTARPFIDFYIFKDGEEAFTDLLGKLMEHNLNAYALKSSAITPDNTHYRRDGIFLRGKLRPSIDDLNRIPSPYLTGLLDKFFELGLIPLTQTTRGCPFSCTYCQDGDNYTSKVKRFAQERIDQELEYIAQRSKAPILMWGDLNLGMYKEDLDTCRTIARLRKQYGWPQSLDVCGKNKKDRILEAARIIDGDDLSGGAVTLLAAVQSTDPEVLRNIKRDNVSVDVMIDLAKKIAGTGTSSFSEVILGLPGDSKKAHFKSIFDLMECGINVVRSHQFLMLPGSEACTRESRRKYMMETRYRVTPRTANPCQVFGETLYAPEIDEICVANNTLSFQDYLDCRVFNLTVEIFYNYGLFHELLALLRLRGVSIPAFIMKIHTHIITTENPLSEIYNGFLKETNELFGSIEELKAFLHRPGTIQKYIKGELGNNEQLMYRALAIFNHMDHLHDMAYSAACSLLSAGEPGNWLEEYLNELKTFSLLRKIRLLDVDQVYHMTFHYAFDNMLAHHFRTDPRDYFKKEGCELTFTHSPGQRTLIKQYIDIYGLDNYGLGWILGSQTNVNNFYRQI